MIYTNKKFSPVEVEMDFGKITQIQVGERGRGRKLIALSCTSDTILNEGPNADYTIGTTKSGKPRINKSSKNDPSETYFLLSSKGGYTRRGDGIIYVNDDLIKQNSVELIASGNGADGDAGRIGYWQTALLKIDISKNGCIAISPSGSRYGLPTEYIIINDGNIYRATEETVRDLCDELDIDCPVTFEDDKAIFKGFWDVTNMEQAKKKIAENEIYNVDQIAESVEKFNIALEYTSKQNNLYNSYKMKQVAKSLLEHDNLSEETRRAILLNEELLKDLLHDEINEFLAKASLETQELFIRQKIDKLKNMIKNKSYDVKKFSFGDINVSFFNDNKIFDDMSFSDEEKKLIAEYSYGKIKFTDPILAILSAKKAKQDTQFEILSSIEDKEKYKELIRETTIGKIICPESKELKEIISQYPLLFKYIKDPNKELYMLAIENLKVENSIFYWGGEGYSSSNLEDILQEHPLKYMENPDDEMIEVAVNKIPEVSSIIDIREELQMKLITNNESLFKFFKTPSTMVQEYIADKCIEKKNPLMELEKLGFQTEYMHIMEKILLNYIKNGKEQIVIDYFQGYTTKNAIICFENLRKLYPDKLNVIAKQINDINYDKVILDIYNFPMNNIYNTFGSNDMVNKFVHMLLNRLYDGADLKFLSSIIDITNSENRNNVLLALENNVDEKDFMNIVENGFYYTKSIEADPKNKQLISNIFDITFGADRQKMIYECIKFNATNPIYKVDLKKATGCEIKDYFEREKYSDIKLGAVLELVKQNINPIIIECLKNDSKIKTVVDMLKNKTLDISIFTKEELDIIHGGLTNFKNWHRISGKTNLSDTFVISASGDILPPDSNELANSNHRYHYQTEQECINRADGTQKWNNIPTDAIVITYSKEDSRSCVDFEIKWMPKELTQEQKDTIKGILKTLVKSYNEINPNDLIELLSKTQPNKLNGMSLTELSQYTINLKKVDFDADINTMLEQLDEIKENDKEAISDKMILPSQTQGGDAI